MSKLTLEALKQRAETVTSTDLLLSISGGTENDCHDSWSEAQRIKAEVEYDMYKRIGDKIAEWWDSW